MGNNQTFNNRSFVPRGGANLAMWSDLRGGGWLKMGRVDGVAFRMDQETEKLLEIIGYRDRTAMEMVTGETAQLSGVFREPLDPDVAQLLWQDLGNSSTITSSRRIKKFVEHIKVYRNRRTGLAEEVYALHSVGLARAATLPPAATFVSTVANDAGGSFPAGPNTQYYAWAVPVHMDPDSAVTPDKDNITDAANLDIEWTFGDPWDEDTATSGYQGDSVVVPDATTSVTFTGTAPATGPTPSYWAIFVNTSNTITGSTCWQVLTHATFTGAGTALLAVPTGDTYAVSANVKISRNSGTDASPSWSHLAVGSDASWDATRGSLKWDSMTQLQNGMRLRVIQWYVEEPTIDIPVGESSVAQDLRKFLIINEGPEVDGADPLRREGYELTVFSANAAALRPMLENPERGWAAGSNFEMECLQDPSNDNNYSNLMLFGDRYVAHITTAA